ncbi:hypothetical protein HNP77_001442 [Treponema rectale]|uniref:Uncharacterized protein n=1 Tax=Treponema rectale TaxID=744512 RepID=A0A840SHS5_9SPIR|nr:hypothetical protein [Treponema rectale]
MSGGNLDYFYSRFDEPLEKISKEIKWGKTSGLQKCFQKTNSLYLFFFNQTTIPV